MLTIVHTFHVKDSIRNIKAQARQFSLLLALEKGYTADVVKVKNGYRVLASDNKAVDFIKKG